MKVIDFSLAIFFRQPAEPCGTPEFMAPELITNPDEIAKTGAPLVYCRADGRACLPMHKTTASKQHPGGQIIFKPHYPEAGCAHLLLALLSH